MTQHRRLPNRVDDQRAVVARPHAYAAHRAALGNQSNPNSVLVRSGDIGEVDLVVGDQGRERGQCSIGIVATASKRRRTARPKAQQGPSRHRGAIQVVDHPCRSTTVMVSRPQLEPTNPSRKCLSPGVDLCIDLIEMIWTWHHLDRCHPTGDQLGQERDTEIAKTPVKPNANLGLWHRGKTSMIAAEDDRFREIDRIEPCQQGRDWIVQGQMPTLSMAS